MESLWFPQRMRRCWVSFAVLAVTATVSAQTWDASRFMGVDEIKRGQRGYILTVVEDTKIEKLEIEILSVEKKYFPQGDLIWAIGVSDAFRHMGPVAGMSGSPAFIGDRLIGAFAYSYTFPKDPILGITPVAQMLKVWERNMTPAPPKRVTKLGMEPLLTPKQWYSTLTDPHGERREPFVITDNVIRHTPEYDTARGARLAPLQTPLMLSGVGDAVAAVLERFFGKYGIVPVQGGVGGGAPGNVIVDSNVTPGAALGIEFIRGDMTAFVFGTVTYREGNRLLAFGHPMFGEGDSYLPISAGFVHFVFSGVARSFKVASPTGVIGTLVQDREAAIAGVVSENHPAFLPMSVTVRRQGGAKLTVFNYELLQHPDMTTSLALSAALSSMETAEKEFGEHTIRAKSKIEFADSANRPPFEQTDIFSSRSSPGFAAATMVFPLNSILNNWFEELPIRNVALEIEYGDLRNTATLDSVRLSKTRVKPGETVELTAVYRPYLDDPIAKRYPIRIPAETPEGFILLYAGDADTYRSWDRSRATDKYNPSNVTQLLKILSQGESSDHLVVSLMSANVGVAVAGAEMPNLPLTMLSVMSAPAQNGESSLTRGTEIAMNAFPTPYVLNGSTLLPLVVDNNAP
jgi:hypothetical protein